MNKVLKINKIFASIQGEAFFQGFPCVFVRLHGCNLNCNYCDTKLDNSDFMLMTSKQVYDKVKSFGIQKVCITGGEPLLQIENLYWLLEELGKDYDVSVETNGAIKIPEKADFTGVFYVIDIKCPSSGQSVDWDIVKYNIPIIGNSCSEIKFVVSTFNDFNFAVDAMEKINKMCDENRYEDYCERGMLDYYDSNIHFYPTYIFSPIYYNGEEKDYFKFANWIARQLFRLNLNGAKIQLQLHKLIGVE